MNFCIMKFQALSYDSSQIICKNNAENIVQDYATLNLSMLSSQKQIKILEELCHSPSGSVCMLLYEKQGKISFIMQPQE